jgi:hypothetical protein
MNGSRASHEMLQAGVEFGFVFKHFALSVNGGRAVQIPAIAAYDSLAATSKALAVN